MWRRAVALTALATGPLSGLVIWAVIGSPGRVVSVGDPPAHEASEIAVRASTWAFTPSVIRARPHDTLRFAVASDDIQHGFAINELGINLQLVAGQERRSPTVTLALPPGRYVIHCSVFCGLGHPSMKATLVVGDPGPTLGQRLPWIASLAGLVAVAGFAARARARPGRREDPA